VVRVVWSRQGHRIDVTYADDAEEQAVGPEWSAVFTAEEAGLAAVPTLDGTLRRELDQDGGNVA